jgi:hypothetical protein
MDDYTKGRLNRYAMEYLDFVQADVDAFIQAAKSVFGKVEGLLKTRHDYDDDLYRISMDTMVGLVGDNAESIAAWQSTVQRMRAADYGGVNERDLLSKPFVLRYHLDDDVQRGANWRVTSFADHSINKAFVDYDTAREFFLALVDHLETPRV